MSAVVREGVTRDERWARIRRTLSTVPSIDPDDHADGIVAMLDSCRHAPPPGEPFMLVDLDEVRPRRKKRKPTRVDCGYCQGMGYLPNEGRCVHCNGRGGISVPRRKSVA